MEITFNDNETLFFVSDTHFNHKKLCSQEEVHFDRVRHYEYVNEMNEDIVNKWNETVTNNDIVIFMGDFIMGTPNSKLMEEFIKYYNALNFKHMYMIKGNHDHELFKKIRKSEVVFDRITLVDDYMEITYKEMTFLVQHYNYNTDDPVMGGDSTVINDKIAHNVYYDFYLHGHTHLETIPSDISHLFRMYQFNMCWDAWYKPVSFKDVLMESINYRSKKGNNV